MVIISDWMQDHIYITHPQACTYTVQTLTTHRIGVGIGQNTHTCYRQALLNTEKIPTGTQIHIISATNIILGAEPADHV